MFLKQQPRPPNQLYTLVENLGHHKINIVETLNLQRSHKMTSTKPKADKTSGEQYPQLFFTRNLNNPNALHDCHKVSRIFVLTKRAVLW